MEYIGFRYDEKTYSLIDNCLESTIIDDDGNKKITKILFKKGKDYYFIPTYIDKNNDVRLYKKYKGFDIVVKESTISYFVEAICKKSLNEQSILQVIHDIVKRHINRDKVIFDINRKFSITDNYVSINEDFIKDIKVLEREKKNLENVFNSIINSKANEYLYSKKYIKNKRVQKALYKSNILSDILSSTILSYSDDTIIKKLSKADIDSTKKVISKISSVLDFRFIKNIQEKQLLKEAIMIGDKILSIKDEDKSNPKIKNIYNNYLKQEDFNKYFEKNEKVQLEKLWEAYITKFSSLILDTDRSNIDNQLELKRINRTYIPDFVMSDLYGTKTIIEIKTHLAPVVNYDKSHDCLYFSSACNKAIGQIQSYIKKSVLSENSDKEYFSSAKGIIIIGNRHIDQEKNIHLLNIPSTEEPNEYYFKSLRDLSSVLINIEIIYFDDLIDSMKKRLNRFI